MPTVPTRAASANLGGAQATPFAVPNAPLANNTQVRPAQLSTSLLGTPQARAQQLRPAYGDPNALHPVQLADGNPQQYEQAGRALNAASDVFARYAAQQQLLTNATAVDGALDEARQAAMHLTWGSKDQATGNIVGGYRNLEGEDAVRPGQTALDEQVGGDFDKQVKEIAKRRITNDAQQRAFDAQVNDIGTQLRAGALTHMADQRKIWTDKTYTASVANQTAAFAMLNGGDKEGQAKALAGLDQAVAVKNLNAGGGDQMLAEGQRAARSAAVEGLFNQLVTDNKTTTAQGLIGTYGAKTNPDGSPYLDPNTLAKMKATLDGKVGTQMGQQDGKAIWESSAKPAFNTGDADRGFNIILHQGERTNGQQVGKDGKLITSPKGAYGAGQLMPDTAKQWAKELGKPELAELSKQPTEEGRQANLTLAQYGWGKLVAQFGGDQEKAAVAYNAGAGYLVGGKRADGTKIEGALKYAARTGDNWRNSPELPKETQDYRTRFTTALGAGDGAPQKPKLADLIGAAETRAQAEGWPPTRLEAAKADLAQRYSVAEKDERDTQDQAVTRSIQLLDASGGNINAVPPELRAAVGDKLPLVQAYGEKLAKGENVASDPATKFQLGNDTYLKGLSDQQMYGLRTKLSPADFEQYSRRRFELMKPNQETNPHLLDTGMAKGVVDLRLGVAGVVTAGRGVDTPRVAAIRETVNSYLLAQQIRLGHKLSYDEMSQFVSQAFNSRMPVVTTNMLTGSKTREGVNVMTMQANDIPSNLRAAAIKQLNKAGVAKPTDAQILGVVQRHYTLNDSKWDM